MEIECFCGGGKRYKYLSLSNYFYEQIKDVLQNFSDTECLAKNFDEIFLKLLQVIKNNIDNYMEFETPDVYILLEKFVNSIKVKIIDFEMEDVQKYFFSEVCDFLSSLYGDSYFTKIHNSVGITPLEMYKCKSFGEQLFHNMYGREWGFDKSCEGGSCSYRTVLFFDFFSKLKEAGLNIDIKIYRFKNLEDIVDDCPTLRHSGLIVTFQNNDYLIENNGNLESHDCIIDVKSLVENSYKTSNADDIKFFENLKHKNQKNTDKVVFFDNTGDFINHVKRFPEYKKISLYIKKEGMTKPVKFNYTFTKDGVIIMMDSFSCEFVLDDNELSRNNFLENFIERLQKVRDKYGSLRPINEDERIFLKTGMEIIKNKINADGLYEYYTS